MVEIRVAFNTMCSQLQHHGGGTAIHMHLPMHDMQTSTFTHVMQFLPYIFLWQVMPLLRGMVNCVLLCHIELNWQWFIFSHN